MSRYSGRGVKLLEQEVKPWPFQMIFFEGLPRGLTVNFNGHYTFLEGKASHPRRVRTAAQLGELSGLSEVVEEKDELSELAYLYIKSGRIKNADTDYEKARFVVGRDIGDIKPCRVDLTVVQTGKSKPVVTRMDSIIGGMNGPIKMIETGVFIRDLINFNEIYKD